MLRVGEGESDEEADGSSPRHLAAQSLSRGGDHMTVTGGDEVLLQALAHASTQSLDVLLPSPGVSPKVCVQLSIFADLLPWR